MNFEHPTIRDNSLLRHLIWVLYLFLLSLCFYKGNFALQFTNNLCFVKRISFLEKCSVNIYVLLILLSKYREVNISFRMCFQIYHK